MFWVVLSRLASYWSKAGRTAPTDKGKVLSFMVRNRIPWNFKALLKELSHEIDLKNFDKN
jgi:hypothetical protein